MKNEMMVKASSLSSNSNVFSARSTFGTLSSFPYKKSLTLII